MSNFKFCPMCGTKREDDSQFCKNCNFEFLVGKYVKLDDEKPKNDVEITVEKVSQEEFVKSNDILRETRNKINYCIAKYLNNELKNQYGENYNENIDLSCANITDRFSLANTKAQLTYPVGLLTYSEINASAARSR